MKETWIVRCFICRTEAEAELDIDPKYGPEYMGRTLAPFPKHESDGGTFLPVRPASPGSVQPEERIIQQTEESNG